MNKIDDTLQRFWNFCRQNRLPQAILKAIPYIGPSIETVIYGDNMENLILEVKKETAEHQEEIRAKLESLMTSLSDRKEYVLVVGGANAEHVLSLEEDLRWGRKHKVTYHEVIGGSGVNYSLRLINAGVPVFPILNVGSDRLGRNIRDELLASARRAKLPEQALAFIESNEYFTARTSTALSTIIVEEDQRTIFSSQVRGSEHFKDHLEQRIADLQAYPGVNIGAVIIGHIHADNPDVNPSNPGGCTKDLIQSFGDRCLVFGNFGNSQISKGVDFWEDDLEKLRVFQLNLDEMRRFFGQKNGKTSLVEIVEWFRDRHVTAVITLDKFGAVGTYRDGRDGVILAWPYELDDFVDSTGAGDAFGAGLVSELYNRDEFSFSHFFNAICEARVWAAYACTTLGGATKCPDKQLLRKFYDEKLAWQIDPVEVQQIKHVDRILGILDKAY